MSSLQEIRAGFIRIYEDIVRARGMPTIMGRIMAVLLLEGRELSHKEVATLTGYSMASVNRTLNQLVNFGMLHKHKDPLHKHYVFHLSIDVFDMIAGSLEKMIKVYSAQKDELGSLIQKLAGLKLEETEQAELDTVNAVLRNFESVLELITDALEKTVNVLHSIESHQPSP